MQLIRTEGCVCYGTTIDGKNLNDISVEDQRRILLDLIGKVDSATIQDFINDCITTMGDYECIGHCDECGDSISEWKWDTEVTAKPVTVDEVNDTIANGSFDADGVSDGYHTFGELYNYRKLYNAAFFNELVGKGIKVHKSKRHSTGDECFGGGWFIVMAELPTGQISNHYEMKDWDLFKVPEQELADKWDGHTPQQAAERLEAYLK